jgi:hypothetical protein
MYYFLPFHLIEYAVISVLTLFIQIKESLRNLVDDGVLALAFAVRSRQRRRSRLRKRSNGHSTTNTSEDVSV